MGNAFVKEVYSSPPLLQKETHIVRLSGTVGDCNHYPGYFFPSPNNDPEFRYEIRATDVYQTRRFAFGTNATGDRGFIGLDIDDSHLDGTLARRLAKISLPRNRARGGGMEHLLGATRFRQEPPTLVIQANSKEEAVLREVTKNNPPILLAFWPVFFVAAIGEYPDMHLMPRLEYEPKFGAIMGGLFFGPPT